MTTHASPHLALEWGDRKPGLQNGERKVKGCLAPVTLHFLLSQELLFPLVLSEVLITFWLLPIPEAPLCCKVFQTIAINFPTVATVSLVAKGIHAFYPKCVKTHSQNHLHAVCLLLIVIHFFFFFGRTAWHAGIWDRTRTHYSGSVES